MSEEIVLPEVFVTKEDEQWAIIHYGDDRIAEPAKHIAAEMHCRERQLLAALKRIAELESYLDIPEIEDFFKGIEAEAAHQRKRWPSEHDAGKSHADWFWLVGYLAGKCLHAAIAGNQEKALHHTISTAAALANWHRAIKGAGNMRPGIDVPAEGQEDAR